MRKYKEKYQGFVEWVWGKYKMEWVESSSNR